MVLKDKILTQLNKRKALVSLQEFMERHVTMTGKKIHTGSGYIYMSYIKNNIYYVIYYFMHRNENKSNTFGTNLVLKIIQKNLLNKIRKKKISEIKQL